MEASKIHLLRVDIVSASIENPLEVATKEINDFNFSFGYGISFSINEKIVKTDLEINLSTDLEESGHQAKGKFNLAFLFSVDNFDDLVRLNGKDLEVSDELAIALTSISYSTARGVLLTRFQGTIFREFILPVISPGDILSKLDSTAEEG